MNAQKSGQRAPSILAIGAFRTCALTVATTLLLSRPAAAQEPQYRERDVLDRERDEWVSQPAPELGPDDVLGQARALVAEAAKAAQEQPDRARGAARKHSTPARKMLEGWLRANPDEPRYYEAEYLLGETYFMERDFWQAAKRYQSVAENSSGELFQLANGRCIDVARAFLAGEKRIVWRVLRLPAQDDGLEILDRVWQRAPGTRLGELALRMRADYYFAAGDLDLAQDEYANLAEQYPSGRYLQFALLRTAEAAQSRFGGVQYDERPLIEAAERYRQMQDAFPQYAERERVDVRLAGIRQSRADKELEIGRWYEHTRRPAAAEYYYRQVVADWSDTPAASEARGRLRALGVRLEGEPEPTETIPASRPAIPEETQP